MASATQDLTTAHAQTRQKVIKDKAEFDAFIAAQKTTDPTRRAAAIEAFIANYPASVVQTEALDQAITAYQQNGDGEKIESTAKRLVALEPDNIRALAILTVSARQATTKGDPKALAAMRDYARRGLLALSMWKIPGKMSATEFNKMRSQFDLIFNGAAGFGWLNAQNYKAAQVAYIKAVIDDPDDAQNFYQLGIAEMQMTPADASGLWHLAKAIALATAQNDPGGAQEIEKYAKAEYHQYHGSDDGWDAIVLAAAKQTTLPDGFSSGITRGPTPPEIAVQVVHDHDPATLSIADWEYILSFRDSSPANKDAADKVWAAIQAKEQNGTIPVEIPVMVMSATANAFDAAITDANVAAKNADLHVVMAQLLVPQPTPTPGTTVNVVGIITSYSTKPFLFTMSHGRL